tara:strand:+ start:1376 stop:1915 length:540 start_codon:yes stop_codon:yes gene_type:complete
VKKLTNKHIKFLKKDDQNLFINYNKILAKEKVLKKLLKKINKQKVKLKNEHLELINERKKISSQVKTIYNRNFTTISVVFDKRWKTYICIFKNNESQKSLYLGKHDLIVETLSQYYHKDEFVNSTVFLKSELKKILISIQNKILSISSNNKIIMKKNKLENIIQLYGESGNWDYWSIDN